MPRTEGLLITSLIIFPIIVIVLVLVICPHEFLFSFLPWPPRASPGSVFPLNWVQRHPFLPSISVSTRGFRLCPHRLLFGSRRTVVSDMQGVHQRQLAAPGRSRAWRRLGNMDVFLFSLSKKTSEAFVFFLVYHSIICVPG